MLSEKTFLRLLKSPRRFEENENNLSPSKEEQELIKIADNFEMIKVYESGTNNYTFQLQPKYNLK